MENIIKYTLKKTTIGLVSAAIAGTTLVSGPLTAMAESNPSEVLQDNIMRLGSSSRIKTAIRVSNEVFDSANNVVLAGYSGEVDALTGTLLASEKNAPLLLVGNKDHEIKDVIAEIERLGAKNVYLLGGERVINKKIENSLSKYSVKRIKGNNRFSTAAAVAKEVANGQSKKHIFLTNDGRSGALADALTTGPVSGKHRMPVLLTSKHTIPQPTIDALSDLGVEEVTIVGGDSAVGKNIESILNKTYKVNRIKGSNRYETGKRMAQIYFPDNEYAILASGGGPRNTYADALVGGYFGAIKNAPLLLTPPGSLNQITAQVLKEKSTAYAYILGGNAAISSPVESAISKILFNNSNSNAEPSKPNEDKGPIITTDERIETVDIKYKTIRKNDPTLEIGKTIIQTKGKDGKSEKVFIQTYEDGVLKGESLSHEVIISKAIDEVIMVGTKEKPQGSQQLDMKTFNMEEFNKEFLTLVNTERTRIGIFSLAYDSKLQRGTDIRAKEIATQYSHIRPDDTYYSSAFEYLYEYPDSVIDENIARALNIDEIEKLVSSGKTTFEKAYAKHFFDVYKASSGHYKNMVSKNTRLLSVSLYRQSASVYNAMIFSNDEIY